MAEKPGGVSRIGALIIIDPEQARGEILDAIDRAHGHRGKAAAALGTKQRTLYRWIARLGMWEAVDMLCSEKGYAVQPGPGHG